MVTSDAAIARLRQLKWEFREFCKTTGAVSESDTRAKLIDEILRSVLGWPEASITRETHTDTGFIDYCLKIKGRQFVAVEAKREGIAFTCPVQKQRSLKLSGSLLTDKPIREAIAQVRDYCDSNGIRYAIATNGYAWILFRAITDGTPWKSGNALVFRSLDHIEENFTQFWNLLCYEAISSGAIDTEFGVAHRTARQLERVVAHLFNADLPLQRNRLNAQLQPLIKTIFEDIADQDHLDILQRCYVYSRSLRIVARDLNCVVTDALPAFLQKQGAVTVQQGHGDAGSFGSAMVGALKGGHGQLILILGGIGSGKTTFLKRYQRTVGKASLDKFALWFHVDFLAPPANPNDITSFIWKSILEQLHSRYAGIPLESRTNLKLAFEDKIKGLEETVLNGLEPGTSEYEKVLSKSLRSWQADVTEYVPRLLVACQKKNERTAVIFIDNVDQLSPAYQSQIFLISQYITRTIRSITIISLREESYYAPNIQKTFTAYTNRKFHIASPYFRWLIQNRIKFALHLLEKDAQESSFILPSGIAIDKTSIADFLTIVEYSIFEVNKNISRFIEAICFGNMRTALEMFATFLTSGATDVDKMLSIYHRDGAYYVAFHEFVKSIMLGERCYYKESQSPILNLFDCGSEKNSSHFTALRILNFLLAHRGESSPEGQGYFDIGRILAPFEDVFDDREDFIRTINRLVKRQLVETNSRSTETIEGASHVRVTSAGWYYMRYLVHSFPYLDLVLQDTPLNSTNVEQELRDMVFQVDNLKDKEEEKEKRNAIRFARVNRFLEYLKAEEEAEFETFQLGRLDSLLATKYVPGITHQFERQKAYIQRRVAQNREKFAEELPFEIPEDESNMLSDDDLTEPDIETGLPA